MVDDHNVPKLEELVTWAKEAKEFTEAVRSRNAQYRSHRHEIWPALKI